MKLIFSLVAATVLLVACGPSTRIEKSWKDPSSSTMLSDYQKILVVCFAKDETSRRIAEEKLAAKLNGRGVPSYNYTFASLGKDSDAYAEQLKKDGFDAAIVTRLVDKEKETSYVPGTMTGYYGGFRPYWGYGYGTYYTPGYYTEDKIYYYQCQVFDLKTEKLVWSGVTSTTNPGKLEKSINEISMVMADQMRDDNFLPKGKR